MHLTGSQPELPAAQEKPLWTGRQQVTMMFPGMEPREEGPQGGGGEEVRSDTAEPDTPGMWGPHGEGPQVLSGEPCACFPQLPGRSQALLVPEPTRP